MLNRNRLAGLLLLLLLAIGIVFLFRPAPAEPVVRLVFGTPGSPVEETLQIPIPNMGHLHASVAIDRAGDFYILSGRQDTTGKAPGFPDNLTSQQIADSMPWQRKIVHVLVAGADGKIKRAVPLKRLDGRLVRGNCDFLAVSPSGKHWWTLRQSHESRNDWTNGGKRTVLLTVYNSDGTPLDEWKVSIALAFEVHLLTVTETEAHVFPETLEASKQFLAYQLGRKQPQVRSWPGSWLPPIGGNHAADGKFWHLQPHHSGAVEAYVSEFGKPSRVFATFQWHQKGTHPYLLQADEKAGLFMFERLKEENGDLRFADGAKAFYHVSSQGVIRKLFETPDVLQTRRGERTRAGQPLKVDEKYVWMEVEYLKNDKVTEYQIVKVPYR